MENEKMSERKLPRRDWVLLPLIGLLVICSIASITVVVAGRLYGVSRSSVGKCLVENDPSTGVRGIPNSVCWEKTYESPWAENRFNDCGHRSAGECSAKPAGTYRIVMMGSSINYGRWTQQDKSFAELLPKELSRSTGRHFELYNESMLWGFPASAALRFREVLDAKPDIILWPISPFDIDHASEVYVDLGLPDQDDNRTFTRRLRNIVRHALGKSEEEPEVMLRNLFYSSKSIYINSYLRDVDDNSGFLRTKPSDNWQNHVKQFSLIFAKLSTQAKAAGVPMVVVLIPNRGQTAMISNGTWPDGFDPFKLDKSLRMVVTTNGESYISILPDYRSIPNPERGYFSVDGHPNSNGHALLADLLAKELTSGAIPELSAKNYNSTAQDQSK